MLDLPYSVACSLIAGVIARRGSERIQCDRSPCVQPRREDGRIVCEQMKSLLGLDLVNVL